MKYAVISITISAPNTPATLNPITYVLEAGRSLISGTPSEVALAYGVGLCLVAGFGLWGFRGLRRAEAAG